METAMKVITNKQTLFGITIILFQAKASTGVNLTLQIYLFISRRAIKLNHRFICELVPHKMFTSGQIKPLQINRDIMK